MLNLSQAAWGAIFNASAGLKFLEPRKSAVSHFSDRTGLQLKDRTSSFFLVEPLLKRLRDILLLELMHRLFESDIAAI